MRLYLAEQMIMAKPYLEHLKSSKNLETTYEAVRAGFVALALEKNRRATPLVAEAKMDLRVQAPVFSFCAFCASTPALANVSSTIPILVSASARGKSFRRVGDCQSVGVGLGGSYICTCVPTAMWYCLLCAALRRLFFDILQRAKWE
jgi:hypothetical protein